MADKIPLKARMWKLENTINELQKDVEGLKKFERFSRNYLAFLDKSKQYNEEGRKIWTITTKKTRKPLKWAI